MCASICQDSSIAKPSADPGWRFWIDRGGTFTDLVARHPDGRLIVHKLLSQNDSCYQDAALAGIREVLELDADAPLSGQPISQIRMGTTVATNALLERKGEPVLLVVNCGFHDALKIAYQNRPDLFARKIELTDQLYHDVLEASCRIDHEGHLIHPLDPAEIEAGLQQHFAKGLRSLAIVFMHGYRFPDHEQAVAAIARTIGFTHISTSHDTIPLVKLIGRGDTTVADAYLSPILRRYVDRIAGELGGIQVQFMQSSGGLINAQRFLGKDSILSGPAGGIIGASEVAEQIGYDRLITFDMGGTSTDVALYDRGLERSFDQMISQIRVRAPMLNIHTVAAGGGSICHFTQGRYQTGPDSAGADPGPACYRRGGPLTITDCNLVLGKLDPAWFPHIFGERRDAPLDREVVEQQFARLASQIEAETGKRTSAVQAAQGFLDVAVENMAQAIKKISVARGFDVTEFCLVAFGGAGGQHACLVADRLGIETIMIHPLASVLSAYGMGRAAVRILRQQSLERKLELETMDIIDQMFDELTIKANQELAAQQISADDPEVRIETLHRIHLRYAGSDNALELDRAGLDELHQQFQTLHLQRFGYVMDKPDLVAATVAVELSAFHEFDKD
ncbi:MAG: hydantoinase/oxoprolinase family protein, partial [Pseudomonadota bacterium]